MVFWVKLTKMPFFNLAKCLNKSPRGKEKIFHNNDKIWLFLSEISNFSSTIPRDNVDQNHDKSVR